MITITKDKIYLSNLSLRKTRFDCKSVEEMDINDIIFYMGDEVELGEDVTFERIFDLIIFHKNFFNILNSQDMDGLEIDDFIIDYEKKTHQNFPHQDYILRISWSGVIYDLGNSIEMYDYPTFEAFGMIDNRQDEFEYPISLSLTPLNQIRKKPLILNNDFSMQTTNSEENPSFLKIDYRPFKFYDLISSILRDVSHYGSPEDRDKAREEAEIKGEEIAEWLNNKDSLSHIDDFHQKDQEAFDIISEEVAQENEPTFWSTIYPNSKLINQSKAKEKPSEIIIKELEIELDEAVNSDNYEKAAEIKKILDEMKKK